jgi:hypothetical protein
VFAICVWNGANFYFDIFADTYTKRLQLHITKTIDGNVWQQLNINVASESPSPIGTPVGSPVNTPGEVRKASEVDLSPKPSPTIRRQ